MSRIYLGIAFFVSIIFFYPATLWATRGSEDYGIFMAVMFMIYTFPIGSLLLYFIIYLYDKLKSTKKPEKKYGRIIFVLSIIIIVLTSLILLMIVFGSDNHYEMFELMSGVLMPIIVLAIISLVLAVLVKKRSLLSDEDFIRMREIKSEQSGTGGKKSKIFIIGSILVLLVLIVFIFKYCFT